MAIQPGCGRQNKRRFALRLLAVTSPERVPGASELPTVRESGVTGSFEVNGWYGIGAPACMPAALVERLNQDINRVLDTSRCKVEQ